MDGTANWRVSSTNAPSRCHALGHGSARLAVYKRCQRCEDRLLRKMLRLFGSLAPPKDEYDSCGNAAPSS